MFLLLCLYEFSRWLEVRSVESSFKRAALLFIGDFIGDFIGENGILLLWREEFSLLERVRSVESSFNRWSFRDGDIGTVLLLWREDPGLESYLLLRSVKSKVGIP